MQQPEDSNDYATYIRQRDQRNQANATSQDTSSVPYTAPTSAPTAAP